MRSVPLLCMGALLACGGGGGGAGGPTAPDPPGQNTPPPSTGSIQMRSQGDIYGDVNHYFQPTSVTIAVGGQVTWSNNSGFAHNVTFTGANAPANIPDFAAGAQSRSFPTAGTFNFHCTLHDMQGLVRVQ